MTCWPSITVVTPSYNQARFLEATLRSVLEQRYPNLEYMVMDGGSDDGSVDIIKRFEGQLSYWVSEADEGQTDALIKGFSRATGDILCWLNSDDLFEPWTLQEVARYFTGNSKAQAVYGDATWIDIEGRPIRSKKEHPFDRFIWMYYYNYVPQPSTFWRRALYEEVGGLDPDYQLAMDADLWARFAERCTIAHVGRRWSRMRSYPEQRNQRYRDQSLREDRRIRERYVGREPEWSLRVKALAARTKRVSWRLATGRYP